MPKYIPLGRSGKLTVVDDEDFEYLSQWKWRLNYKGYVIATVYDLTGKRITIRMHRLIMNPPSHMQVDHINQKPFDNRRRNLRICNRAENSRNTGKRSNNKSGFKGVSWDRPCQGWRSQICYESQVIYLGSFKSKHEAARAYNTKAVELFGEFAWLNKVPHPYWFTLPLSRFA